MKRKKISKLSKDELSKLKHRKTIILNCANNCGRSIEVDSEAVSAICYVCTSKMAPIEKKIMKVREEGFVQGWHLKKTFVHKDGRVFHEGVEQPELKGTLQPTDLTELRERKKINKKLREERKERREARLVKRFIKKKEAKKKMKIKNNTEVGES